MYIRPQGEWISSVISCTIGTFRVCTLYSRGAELTVLRQFLPVLPGALFVF